MLYLVAKVIILLASRYFFIIYFYICADNTDVHKDMQTLLNDIELDIQELKCLIQAISGDSNPALRIVAKRNIHQMQERLNAITKLLDETSGPASARPVSKEELVCGQAESVSCSVEPISRPVETSVAAEPVSVAIPPVSTILAEKIKPATDLRHAISLNDSFRFTRELFGGDAARMNEVVRQLGESSSLDKAMDIFNSTVHPDEDNVAAADFIELLRKYFS